LPQNLAARDGQTSSGCNCRSVPAAWRACSAPGAPPVDELILEQVSLNYNELLMAAAGKDGKGRFKDNIFIERLWRTLKYERIYMRVYETGTELAKDMTTWFPWYNERRPHTSLDKRTPNDAYFEGLEKLKTAA